MDYDNFYYQYLSIPLDKADIEKFLEKYPIIESRFDEIKIDEARELLPSIFNWFEKNNLEADQIFLINHKPDFKQDIHRDYVGDSGPRLAINIPLNIKAARAVTRVYDLIGEEIYNKTYRPNDVPYSKFDPNLVKQAAQYISIAPVILNISKPHSAWNKTPHNRGLLTFRFKEDPINLIKDNQGII